MSPRPVPCRRPGPHHRRTGQSASLWANAPGQIHPAPDQGRAGGRRCPEAGTGADRRTPHNSPAGPPSSEGGPRWTLGLLLTPACIRCRGATRGLGAQPRCVPLCLGDDWRRSAWGFCWSCGGIPAGKGEAVGHANLPAYCREHNGGLVIPMAMTVPPSIMHPKAPRGV